jgi:hypothetical protein
MKKQFPHSYSTIEDPDTSKMRVGGGMQIPTDPVEDVCRHCGAKQTVGPAPANPHEVE